jgi:photosystem II stability/assembly factor-like uncharacterized protein
VAASLHSQGVRSEIKPLADQALTLAACSTPDGGLWAAGERGHILNSVDSGRTWQQKVTPTQATLTGIDTSATGTLVAVGHQGTLLRKEPADAGWVTVDAGLSREDNLLHVFHVEGNTWWALGAYGLFLESTDDGISWEQRVVAEEDLHLHSVVRLATDQFLVVGEAGLLLGTDDAGASWTELESPYEGSFFGGLLLESGEVLLHGLRGHLFVGQPWEGDWQEHRTEVQSLLASSVLLDDGQVLIGALGGHFLLLNTSDWDSKSWQDADLPLTTHLLRLRDGSVLVSGGAGPKRLSLSPGKGS